MSRPILKQLLFVLVFWSAAGAFAGTLALRFIDSETGYNIAANVTATDSSGTVNPLIINAAGKTRLANGTYSLVVSAANYRNMTIAFEVSDSNPPLQFLLDPIRLPTELSPGYLENARHDNMTTIIGFAVDDQTGQPLRDVSVTSSAGGPTQSDERGFFQIYLPVETSAPTLIFSKHGYKSQWHENIQTWSGGDWTFRIRMERGEGASREDHQHVLDAAPRQETDFSSNPNGDSPGQSTITPHATQLANATVRIPSNIRVLLSDGVTIQIMPLETYVRHVLPSEWISSWGGLGGGAGINGLKAGAVAIRSYGSYYVSHPKTTTYDICATTSCQVYGSTTSANTDIAVTNTTGYVVIDPASANAIAFAEYSAENNSKANSCGDGYISPSSGCVYDPVCTGETRNGHGRLMCQWGTAKWASGLKLPGNSTSNTNTLNGFPKQDWPWIVTHYYPTFVLLKALPLVIGDDVRATRSVTNYMCADGGIASGKSCPQINIESSGATGTIIDGPQQITADGFNYTWWKIQYADNTIGWARENDLERVIPLPNAPSNLAATAIGNNQVQLTWTQSSTGGQTGLKLERAIVSGGPWTQIADLPATNLSYLDQNRFAFVTNYYRIRGYNPSGNSAYSATVSAMNTNGPSLTTISNKTVIEGATLTFTASGSAADFQMLLTDFENFDSWATPGSVMFRNPNFSASTSTNVDSVMNYSDVSDSFPSNSAAGNRIVFVNYNATNANNPWLRLTTSSATSLPNPVIDFTKKLRFDIYSEKQVKVALGCRETSTTAGTPLGSDGGTAGGIEWVGVTNKSGQAPMPTRVVAAGAWTTLNFDLPNEPCLAFAGAANGVLASGLGVLEHIAVVPTATGTNRVYLDNFILQWPKTLTYSLDPGAPTGASINSTNGIFTWTPTEGQGPGTYSITVRVSDNAAQPQSATRTFSVTVSETNSAPVLAAITNYTLHAGSTLLFTNTASDADLPANTLTYSSTNLPAGASLGANTGVFTWTPGDQFANSTNKVTIKVADNGSPVLSDSKSFLINVVARPTLQTISVNGGNFIFGWSAIAGKKYRIQYKSDLGAASWTDLTDITANSASASFSETAGSAQRFYRIVDLD